MSRKIFRNKVLVSMSGGVDSSTAAAILVEEGYEVIGAFMNMWDCSMNGPIPPSSCCSALNRADARKVASYLGISFHVIEMEGVMKKEVIDPFVDYYLKGLTPNPCIWCNERLKFHYLMERGKSLGAKFLATGHYARIIPSHEEGKKYLLKGIDKEKDQSYFLFKMTQEVMERTIFPLGGYKKEQVKDMARKMGLPISEKDESQEICFITDGDYRSFIEQYLPPDYIRPGEIVNEEGRVIGYHRGIHRFTIGQRKGIGIPSSHPFYVIDINHQENRIVVGGRESLYFSGLVARDLNWVSIDPPSQPIEVMAKIRYRQKEAKAIVKPVYKGRVEVTFMNPQRAITPGQAVVFYMDDLLLGGGWIEKGIRE